MTTLVLADDHAMVRQGLRRLFEAEPDLTVVAETGDGLEVVGLVERYRPDVLVVDLVMPGLDGLEITRRVGERVPETRVVVLSMHAHERYVVEAFQRGAMAYVVKEESIAELVRAVYAVRQGQQFLSPLLSPGRIEAYARHMPEAVTDPYETLTDREREVLHLIGEGFSGPEIARRLSISPRTVGTHRTNLMAKLNLHHQAELVRYALKRGLVTLGVRVERRDT